MSEDKVVFQILITKEGDLKVVREATSVEIYGMLMLEVEMQKQFLINNLTGHRVPVRTDPVDEIKIPRGDYEKYSH